MAYYSFPQSLWCIFQIILIAKKYVHSQNNSEHHTLEDGYCTEMLLLYAIYPFQKYTLKHYCMSVID